MASADGREGREESRMASVPLGRGPQAARTHQHPGPNSEELTGFTLARRPQRHRKRGCPQKGSSRSSVNRHKA